MIRIGVIVFVGWLLVSIPATVLFRVFVRAGRRSWRAPLTLVEGADAIGIVETVNAPIVDPRRTTPDATTSPIGVRQHGVVRAR